MGVASSCTSTWRAQWFALPALLALLGACGESGSPGADAAAGDAGLDGAVSPAELPMMAALPNLLPCPEGWRELASVDADHPAACEPWPDTGRATCAAGEVHWPGAPGCAPIGSPCPSGTWPDDLPTDGSVVYVDASAVAGGDGSMSAPFSTIASAIRVAPTGGTIALARGTYREAFSLTGGVTLRGACVAETTIQAPSASPSAPTIYMRGMGTTVRDVRITGTRPGIIVPVGANAAVLQGVWIDHAGTVGVTLDAAGPSELRDVVISDVAPLADGSFGRGILALDGGQGILDRVLVERCYEAGIFVAGPGASVEAHRYTAREITGAVSGGYGGQGVLVQRGGAASVDVGVFEECVNAGANVAGDGSVVRLSNIVSRDHTRGPDRLKGYGASASDGATLEIDRALIERVQSAGIAGFGAGTTITARDVWVHDLEANDLELAAQSVFVHRGASATVARVLTERAVANGMAAEPGSMLDGTDLTVLDTVSAKNGVGGVGIQFFGSMGTLQRVRIERATSLGVIVSSSSSVRIEDLIVRDTAPASDGLLGRGVHVQGDSQIEGTRWLLERNREAGISAVLTGSMTLTHVTVRTTAERACATTTCPELTAGIGIFAQANGHATVSNFAIDTAALCGAYVGVQSSLDLSDGLVRGCPIGVAVGIPGYDIGRLSTRVVFVDNGRNSDTSMLAVPDATAPL